MKSEGRMAAALQVLTGTRRGPCIPRSDVGLTYPWVDAHPGDVEFLARVINYYTIRDNASGYWTTFQDVIFGFREAVKKHDS